MTNMEKAKEMLEKNPELMEKVNAEAERLTNAKEAATPEEAMVKAIKTVLDIDVPEGELKESRKMNLDELDNVAGGASSYENPWYEKAAEAVCDAVDSALDSDARGSRKACCFFGIHSWMYCYDGENRNHWSRTCGVCGKFEQNH